MRETYVLDTNVLLSDPDILLNLAGCRIIVPIAVISELDRFKSLPDPEDPKAVSAREVSRILDDLGSHGNISRGALTPSGSTVTIYRSFVPVSGLSGADNRIVGAALKLKRNGKLTVLSNDRNLRNVARAHGITATAYPPSPEADYPAAPGILREEAQQIKADKYETKNQVQGFRVWWKYLVMPAVIIIVLVLLAIGK